MTVTIGWADRLSHLLCCWLAIETLTCEGRRTKHTHQCGWMLLQVADGVSRLNAGQKLCLALLRKLPVH